MPLMNAIKSLFGKSSGATSETLANSPDPKETVTYEGLSISPAPIKEGSQYRTAGTISDISSNPPSTTRFVRADLHSSREQAVEHCINKAKQIIDEQGTNLFDRDRC